MTNPADHLSIGATALVTNLKHLLPFTPVMIFGAIGVGKSAIVADNIVAIWTEAAAGVALDRNLGNDFDGVEPVLYERRVNDYDILDFGGLPYNDNGIQRRATPDIWPGAGSSDKVYGVLFLDEFPQAAREKQTVIQRLFDEGRVGDYVLPGHPKSDPLCKRGLVFIVLAGNRQSDRANSHGIGSQTADRLAVLTLEPNLKDWNDWANSPAVQLNPTVVSFANQLPEYFHKVDPKQIKGSTPRGLEKLAKAVDSCPPSNVEMAMYAGIVGEEAARAYLALVHAARSIDIEAALSDPANADIPSEVGHQFAAASLLIRRATLDNFDNIVQYVERVGEGGFSSPEIAVFVVEAVARRNPVMAETSTYRDFAIRWQDVRA
jgi:hypothetical protein